MAGITLEQAQANLDAWLAASVAVAKSQSYRISVDGSERELTRANAGLIKDQIQYWDGMVRQLSGTGRARARRIVFG
jgi:hypothetical protein